MPGINVAAAVVAGVLGFFFGGLWYSKAMFCDVWCREAGVKPPEEQKEGKHAGRVFAVGVALSLVAAFALAAFLGKEPPLGRAVGTGAAAGACFVATSFGINYGFAGKSLKLWLVDAGYHVGQFTLIGLVLGLWH